MHKTFVCDIGKGLSFSVDSETKTLSQAVHREVQVTWVGVEQRDTARK